LGKEKGEKRREEGRERKVKEEGKRGEGEFASLALGGQTPLGYSINPTRRGFKDEDAH